MIYTLDVAQKALLYFFTTIVPSGVDVVDGESYGINLNSPDGKNPSIAVSIDDVGDTAIELGSAGTEFPCFCTINAKSKFQRTALESVVYSGLLYHTLPVHGAYDPITATPTASVIGTLEVQPGIRIRKMPDLNSGQERYFWTSVVSFTCTTLLT